MYINILIEKGKFHLQKLHRDYSKKYRTSV